MTLTEYQNIINSIDKSNKNRNWFSTIMKSSPEYIKLKNILKQGILDKRFPPDCNIPSRKSLMRKYGFARATVDRAVSELISEGILRGQRGSGTYVVGLPDKAKKSRVVYVILHRQTRIGDTIISPFLEVLQDRVHNGLRLKFITINDIVINTETYLKDATAFIFCQLSPTYYDVAVNLQQRNYPILLMNREDSFFDFVTTDRFCAYEKALSEQSGSVGAVFRQICLEDPYLIQGRAGLFRAVAMNPNLYTNPEWILEMPRKFGCKNTVKQVMDMLSNNPPRWLVVDGFLTTCVLTTIHALGMEIGQDINLLLFEPEEKPEFSKGYIEMNQDYRTMGELTFEWLKQRNKGKKFQVKVLPIINKMI